MPDNAAHDDEPELRNAIDRIIRSSSRKKLVVAGPGTGKTTLFKKLLAASPGDKNDRLVLTFINNLKNDLERDLSDYARVFTLHAYCQSLLYRTPGLRAGLPSGFICLPGLATLIKSDWMYLKGTAPPQFVQEMRSLQDTDNIRFYIARGNYYDAVDFDDSVYRVQGQLAAHPDSVEHYELILVDEYQDFNRLEAGFISLLAERSPIVIAGDDDQALYSQLRGSSWDFIRSLHRGGEYQVFPLPFCMRCPEVIVEAVNDVISKAKDLNKLDGRIEKPFKHFSLAKEADSKKYPKIILVGTSVQRKNANYFGRYLVQAINGIPPGEIKAAAERDYPAVLIIAPQPYRDQIVAHLDACDIAVDTKRDREDKLDRQLGIELLKSDPASNIAWRLVLEYEPTGFVAGIVKATADCAKPVAQLLPLDYRDRILAEAKVWEPIEKEDESVDPIIENPARPRVRVTSFEGAKGLSAQHVFIAGLHDGEIPHDPSNIRDIEICKFIVGLTRTQMQCTLLYTRRFADKWKEQSSFISWIRNDRYEFVNVDADYWKRGQPAGVTHPTPRPMRQLQSSRASTRKPRRSHKPAANKVKAR